MTETPAVRRDNAIRSALLGVLVVAFVANLLTTPRPAIGYDGVREYSAVPVRYVAWDRLNVAEPSESGLLFAKLTHLWGWLVILALALYGWFELTAAAHRREAAGII